VDEIPNLMPCLAKQSERVEFLECLSKEKERQPVARKLPLSSIQGFVPVMPDPWHFENQKTGVMHRLNPELPVPDPEWRTRFYAFVARFVATLPVLSDAPGFEDWLGKTSYNDRRKDQLRETYDLLRSRVLPRKLRRKILHFTKVEPYLEIKWARGINSRNDYFKVYSGPWFKAMEEVVYSDHHFIKHVPVPERPGLISGLMAAGARYFETDYKAFESHFLPELIASCEGILYRHLLSKFPEVAETLVDALTGVNVCKSRLGLKFNVRGLRMSGDMCTSLGNGFTNLMLWLFICEEKGCKTDGYVEGDDGIFATYGGESPTAADFRKLGFRIEVTEHPTPWEANFCGMTCADGVIIKEPIESLTKLGWTQSQVACGDKRAMELMRAKALSMCYEVPNCPILGAVARRLVELSDGFEAHFVEDGYHHRPPTELHVPEFDPNDNVRRLFASKFGISSAVQREIEHAARLAPDMSFISKFLSPQRDSWVMEALYSGG